MSEHFCGVDYYSSVCDEIKFNKVVWTPVNINVDYSKL